jgi:hypothetical protein
VHQCGFEQPPAYAPSLTVGTHTYAGQVPEPRQEVAGSVLGAPGKAQRHAYQLVLMLADEQDRPSALGPRAESLRMRRKAPIRICEFPDTDRSVHLVDPGGPQNHHTGSLNAKDHCPVRGTMIDALRREPL